MVKNYLCSSGLKDWLLCFAATCTNIGYTEGVIAVFQVKLKNKKAAEFPFFEDENMNCAKFVDRQITLLQSGIVDFEFLNYLEANPDSHWRNL